MVPEDPEPVREAPLELCEAPLQESEGWDRDVDPEEDEALYGRRVPSNALIPRSLAAAALALGILIAMVLFLP